MNKLFTSPFDIIMTLVWQACVLYGATVGIDKALCFYTKTPRDWTSLGHAAMLSLALLILPRFIDNLGQKLAYNKTK